MVSFWHTVKAFLSAHSNKASRRSYQSGYDLQARLDSFPGAFGPFRFRPSLEQVSARAINTDTTRRLSRQECFRVRASGRAAMKAADLIGGKRGALTSDNCRPTWPGRAIAGLRPDGPFDG